MSGGGCQTLVPACWRNHVVPNRGSVSAGAVAICLVSLSCCISCRAEFVGDIRFFNPFAQRATACRWLRTGISWGLRIPRKK